MNYDQQLLDQVALSKERIFRVYPWKNSGITYSYKQDLPEPLKAIDHSKRITGGGIVFHCPDDIVFSVTSTTEDPFFKKSLKSKLSQISKMIQVAFRKIEFELNTQTVSKNNNIDYCQSYHNPFELYYKTKKVVAFSLRKTRQAFIIQGIIHLNANKTWFSDLPKEYEAYYCMGITPKTEKLKSEVQLSLLDTIYKLTK